MFIDFFLEVFAQNRDRSAMVWKDQAYTYAWMANKVGYWQKLLTAENIAPGTVALLEADFSPNSVALFLALIEQACILVPLTTAVAAGREVKEIAQCQVSFAIDENDGLHLTRFSRTAEHELLRRLKEDRHPGLILFSSGSTGKSKAAVHDFTRLLLKFHKPRQRLTTATFLLYDHIGGVNTMLYCLANGGCLVTLEHRTPDSVLGAVEKYRIELLPTSPTFINLILLSEAYQRYRLDSLKIVSYGTEPMPESTLKRFHELFPDIRLLQTYGLSELGIMRSRSKSSESLWVKVGGENFDTRVVAGILQVKAQSAMMGYLNAPNPFTDDGWFDTGDVVEVDGEYIKILGRRSEVINVGGQKVYPTEVESVIQTLSNVAAVTVYGEKNPITGNIVCARVKLLRPEEKKLFVRRLTYFCRERMESYRVPVKIAIVADDRVSERFKKNRGPEGDCS